MLTHFARRSLLPSKLMEGLIIHGCVPVPHFNDLSPILLKKIAGYCGIQALMQFKKTSVKMNETFGQDSIKQSLIVDLEQDGTLLQKLPDFQDNCDIVLVAVSQNGCALKYASVTLQNDRKIVLAAVSKHGCALRYASLNLQNDPDIVLVAVSQNGCALKYASLNLQNDPDIILVAVSQNG